MVRSLCLLLLLGCADAWTPSGERSTGLAATEASGGPTVVWDPEAEPLPEIPLPNDAATRLDPSSPTGRRLNISALAPTAYERQTRAAFNELDGFGTYAPITVRFDAPLDTADLYARHNPDDDFRNDAVFLLNVDPACDRFGEEVALDVGRGRFPITLFSHDGRKPDAEAPGGYRLERGNPFFPNDAHGELHNLLYPELHEDRNGNGRLDPGEDLDHDGELDVSNLDDPTACDDVPFDTPARERCVADHLMTFYERASHTLVLRPAWPLEERCTYGVVLTKRLRGTDGRAVRSPFPGVNPRAQTTALGPLGELLPRYGLGLDDVAFAWSFTTGTQTHDLLALREGLYGSGPFARLAEEFPVSGLRLWPHAELAEGAPESPALDGACAGASTSWFWTFANEWEANRCALEADFVATGALLGGTFPAPYLLVDDDGIATDRYPADDDERWRLDARTGEAAWRPEDVTFWCALPREAESGCEPGNPDGRPFCKPFPVTLYAHGYGGSRAEILTHYGRHAAMGIAVCALDGPGHGLQRLLENPLDEPAFTLVEPLFARHGVPGLKALVLRGRDRDLDNDGLPDSGADMWTDDIFHTRDMVRQSVLETMQFVRILRSMDGETRDGAGGVLGDVDGDGAPDLGGPHNVVGMWGISLGGIVAGVAAGAEPGFDAVSPNAGGAGLTDIAVRSSQAGVPEAVVMPIMGPLIAGRLPTDDHQNPVAGGELELLAFVQSLARRVEVPLGSVAGVEPGDRVCVRNLDNGEEGCTVVHPRGWFRAAAASDALSAVERRPVLGLTDGDREPVRFEDTARLGDRLEVVFFVGDTEEVRARFDRFGVDATFQGAIYPEGAPLVALQRGLGLKRNTPDFRRFIGIAQHAIGPADPAVWAPHYFEEPVEAPYDATWRRGRTHALVMPTVGDRQVPVNTGVGIARAAGLLGSWRRDESIGPEHGWRELFVPDPRYGKSVDQHLIDAWVLEGNSGAQRYADNPINPNALYDPDDVSDGAARFTCDDTDWSASNGENECPPEVEGQSVSFPVPRHPEHPLRISRERADGSFDAFRVPLLRPAGQHGIYNAQPFREFDADAYMVNYTIRFLRSAGREAADEPGCDCSASTIPELILDAASETPALRTRACTPDDLNVCDARCAAAWDIRTPSRSVCQPD